MIDRHGYWPRRGHEIMADHSQPGKLPPVGLIAGWGSFPIQVAQESFGSYHSGGTCQFVLGDGSVRAIDPSINTVVLGWLANIRDGQVIPKF